MNEEQYNDNDTYSIPFWYDDPNVLFQHIEFFPTDQMTYNQSLNAITRSVILLSILSLIVSQNIRTFFILAITLFAIYILHYYHMKEESIKESKRATLENFQQLNNADPGNDLIASANINTLNIFDKPSPANPFSNVLNSDIDYNPDKKPAPPSFNANVNTSILDSAKQLVVDANPDHPDIANKLFRDLGDQLVFEQSLRQFHSNPNTTIPNDQGAFADFCYGNMISCKEGNNFACARNLARYQNI